jgi:hypothetical protein
MPDLGSLLGGLGVGGNIGKAIVQLELDTAKYQTEMRTAQASTVTGTSAMGSSFSKFSGLATAAFAAVGVAAVAGLALSVKAAIEANDAHLKLQNTFANNAKLSDSSVAAFEAQADALRDLTGVDDEAIVAGQALLGSFKLTGEQVQELTPLVVDLSEKYNIDLQAAFKAVGKATQGSGGVLSRYGIVLDEAKLKADGFGTTLEGLGVAAGFAEASAKQEPWRVIGAQFEEIAETIGQELLPIIQDLSQILIDNIPVVERLAGSFGVLLDVYKDISAISFAPWTVAGDVMDELGVEAADLAGEGLGLDKTLTGAGKTFDDTRRIITRFAGMTGKELTEWKQEAHESFHDFVFDMESATAETRVSQREFARAFEGMQEDARRLAGAMKRLKDDDWVNDRFLEFLQSLGPEYLIRFSKENETQQRRWQAEWRTTGDIVKEKVNDRFDDLVGVLGTLDRGTSKHKVIIQYEYQGFDPSKPGMAGSGQVR